MKKYQRDVSAAFLVAGILTAISSQAADWYAGTWDADNFSYVNGHPTTVALRVEVLNAESGLGVNAAEVRLEGEWTDEDGLQHDFRLFATTGSDGIAVIGLGWQDERRQSSWRGYSVVDDIEKAQRLLVRRSGYAYAELALGLLQLKRDRDAWKTIVSETPRAKFFTLRTNEEWRPGSKTSTNPLFFQKVRDEDYYRVFTADAFANRELDIPSFHERLTIGPFIVLPIRIELRPSVSEMRVERNEERFRREPRSFAPERREPFQEPSRYQRTQERPFVIEPPMRRQPEVPSRADSGSTAQAGLPLGVHGFALNSVWAGLPAGIVIESVDHRVVTSEAEFRSRTASRRPGDQVLIGFWRRTSGGRWERESRIVTVPR